MVYVPLDRDKLSGMTLHNDYGLIRHEGDKAQKSYQLVHGINRPLDAYNKAFP